MTYMGRTHPLASTAVVYGSCAQANAVSVRKSVVVKYILTRCTNS